MKSGAQYSTSISYTHKLRVLLLHQASFTIRPEPTKWGLIGFTHTLTHALANTTQYHGKPLQVGLQKNRLV